MLPLWQLGESESEELLMCSMIRAFSCSNVAIGDWQPSQCLHAITGVNALSEKGIGIFLHMSIVKLTPHQQRPLE